MNVICLLCFRFKIYILKGCNQHNFKEKTKCVDENEKWSGLKILFCRILQEIL